MSFLSNRRSRRLRLEQLEDRRLLATDVTFRLASADAGGTPISDVEVGDSFWLDIYTKDTRIFGDGVFAAYLDVEFDAGLIQPIGDVVHAGDYSNVTSGSSATPGLLDEVGGTAGLSALGPAERLVARQQVRAIDAGTATFTSNAADQLPFHNVLRYGDFGPISEAQIDFGTADVTINAKLIVKNISHPIYR